MKNYYNIPAERIKEMIKEADNNENAVSEDISNKLFFVTMILIICALLSVLSKVEIPEHLLKIICYALGIYAAVKMLNLIGKLVNQSTK